MFGALNTYKATEQQNTPNDNRLVMGPWTHGAWEAQKWDHFAGYQFGGDLNVKYQQLEFDFFNHYLKGAPPAKWMTETIPFKLKGKKSGLELDKSGLKP